jgi:small subunit ribosomal protein S6
MQAVLSCPGVSLHQPGAVESKGGELMKAYELLFFVAPTLDEEARANVMNRIENTITAGEGAIDSAEDWGKRKLAYEINKLTEGDYILINFHANPDHIAELDRVLRINDSVQRHMIVCRPEGE